MSMDYIPKDVARCSNHRCLLRTNCARYMQVAEDRKQPGFKSVPYTRFEPKDKIGKKAPNGIGRMYSHECDKQIKLL